MRNIFLIVVLFCSYLLAVGQTKECKDFKNGKFKTVDPDIGNTIIERQGTKQTEYNERLNLKLEFKVAWISECKYTLKLVKVIENRNNLELPTEMILTCELIELKENSYIQKSSSNLYEETTESEVIKIE